MLREIFRRNEFISTQINDDFSQSGAAKQWKLTELLDLFEEACRQSVINKSTIGDHIGAWSEYRFIKEGINGRIKEIYVSNDMVVNFINSDVDMSYINLLFTGEEFHACLFVDAANFNLFIEEQEEGGLTAKIGENHYQIKYIMYSVSTHYNTEKDIWGICICSYFMTPHGILIEDTGTTITWITEDAKSDFFADAYKENPRSKTMLNFIANAMLYFQSHPEWVERVQLSTKEITGKIGKRKRQEIELDNKNSVIHKIGIPKQIKNCIRAKDFEGESHKINKRFMVRGHWRNQVCGQGRQERRLKFIAPFWKGTEEMPLIEHVYQIS